MPIELVNLVEVAVKVKMQFQSEFCYLGGAYIETRIGLTISVELETGNYVGKFNNDLQWK